MKGIEMKITIATAVYYPQINGVAVFSHNLAVGLARRGHQVMVICPSQTGKNYSRLIDGVKTVYLKSVDAKIYPDQIHAVGAKKKVLGVRWPRLWYKHGFRVSVFPQREIKRALDDFCPDVVHVQVSDPIGLSVVWWAKKNGVPVVTTEHNQPDVITDQLHMPIFVKKPANAMLNMYFRNRQSKSDFVTMPTEKAIRELLGKGEEFPVPVAAVSNGVDLSNFKPGRASSELRKKYGINSDAPVVLYVGRVDPEKKVELVIEAAKQARAKTPQKQGQNDVSRLEVVIVGDGIDKARLERLYRDEKWVHFLGRIVPPELYEVYRLGDVFVTASEIETQGIVLIEAAATGLPLIAVNAGAVGEVCQNNVNGLLCEPGSVVEISDAIVKILSDPALRERLSKKSIEIASEHDFEKTLDKFINIYNKVAELEAGK